MEQNEKQKKEFFEEFKQIYNIKIPIPKPKITKQNHVQKFLFYMDLTDSVNCSNNLFNLSINFNEDSLWQGGFLSEFQFNNEKKGQESIFCYYFNNLIENDEKINIQSLFRFRIFLQEFISTQQNYQMKFVFQFIQKNDNQQEFQDHIVKFIYEILDGSFDKLQDIICVYHKEKIEQINYCKISSKKIHLKKNQHCDSFDLSFIVKLDEFLNYFQYNQNDPNQIGFICYEYIQKKVNVVLKEFEKELNQLYKDIQLMIEFPINLNNEIESKENVSQYLEILKTIICEIHIILSEIGKFDKMSKDLQKVLVNKRQKMIEYLNSIIKENTQFEIYLKLIQKDKQPNEVFNELLQFQFELLETDNEILQKLKKYHYNQDCINATLFRVILDSKQWFKYFNLYLPQSLAYIRRIIPENKDLNLDKPCVFVLGMTRVGKSTLLNILSNPENVTVNKDNKFDVKEMNNKIKISHKNISETFQIQSLEIDNFILFDTPGLRDTIEINRGINHYNIFNEITRTSQLILLLMIDGEQLQMQKNDLIDSISQINLIFGNQSDNYCFEKLILPVFTKIRNDSTMESIKSKWENETMKDVTDQFQLKILNAIKKAIEKDNYLKIYCAEFYLIQDEQKQLESEIQTMNVKANKLFRDKKYQEGDELLAQIDEKQHHLDNLQKMSFSEKMEKIKYNFIRNCNNILKARQNTNQSLNFKFNLTPELECHLQKLLPHRNNFYKHLLNIITNDFIAKMLYDDQIKLDDKFIEICNISNLKLKKLSDIPQELISQNIKDQINELNKFNNIISQYDEKNNQNLQIIDFGEFELQFNYLINAFIGVDKQIQFLKFCKIFEFPKIFKIYKIRRPNFMSLSLINQLFFLSQGVLKQEKEKKEKLNLIKIQQEYYKNFLKSK